MKRQSGAGALAALALTCVFGATLLLSLAAGAGVYRRVADRVERSAADRVSLSYITAKIHGSDAAGKLIKEVEWPRRCLLVSVQRGGEEFIPKGKTRLLASDLLVTLTDERDCASVYKEMEDICRFKGFWK